MRAVFLAALLGGGLVAGSAYADSQTPQTPPPAIPSTKGVVPKGRAPVSDQVLQIKLPRPQEADLANGVHLMVLEDHRVPRISFRLLIPGAGGYFDPAEHPGLASFTAALMREGTATRTSEQIAQRLETINAQFNIGTGVSAVDATVTGSCLTEHFDTLLDLAADILQHPVFADEELKRYKDRTRATLTQQRSNPGFLTTELYARVMYGAHPAGRVAPTIAALDQTTRQQLVDHHRVHYVPDHAVLAAAGDVSLAQARQMFEKRFGGWARARATAPAVTAPAPPPAARVSFVARPNSVQTNFIVGAPGITRTDPDYDVLSVMNKVIGGGPTGRLFINLREDKGYTYGAYSGMSAGRFRGSWSANTDVRTDVTEPALLDLLAEITRMREEAVPEKELRDQKRSMIAAFALSLEDPQEMLNYYVTSWIYKLPADYWDGYPDRIAGVTAQQVQAAAKKYLDRSRLQIVAVGDPVKAGGVLKGFGDVDTYDTEGRRLTPGSP
jgi:zinc protease